MWCGLAWHDTLLLCVWGGLVGMIARSPDAKCAERNFLEWVIE